MILPVLARFLEGKRKGEKPSPEKRMGKDKKKRRGKGPPKRRGKSPPKKIGKIQEWAPDIRPKHRKSLPNRRQQGGAFGAAPLGFVVFDLVRNSYVLA